MPTPAQVKPLRAAALPRLRVNPRKPQAKPPCSAELGLLLNCWAQYNEADAKDCARLVTMVQECMIASVSVY